MIGFHPNNFRTFGPMSYLLDTNTVIDYLGGKLPSAAMVGMSHIIDAGPVLSVINKIELLGFTTDPASSALLMDFVGAATILDLTAPIVDKTIELRKNYSIKLPDAIIAATALFHGCQLVSRNLKDFSKIAGLSTIDPHLQPILK
jgi:predicted nucleic acid-binding protein